MTKPSETVPSTHSVRVAYAVLDPRRSRERTDEFNHWLAIHEANLARTLAGQLQAESWADAAESISFLIDWAEAREARR